MVCVRLKKRNHLVRKIDIKHTRRQPVTAFPHAYGVFIKHTFPIISSQGRGILMNLSRRWLKGASIEGSYRPPQQ